MLTQRAATETDLPTLWSLRTRAVRATCATHYPPETIAIWSAAEPPATMPVLLRTGGGIVMEEGNVIAGYALLDTDSGEVDAVFVEPSRQGAGIGRALLRAIESLARDAGLDRLFLSASLNAVAFYECAGFRVLRERLYPHHSGIQIRSVLMEKRLG